MRFAVIEMNFTGQRLRDLGLRNLGIKKRITITFNS